MLESKFQAELILELRELFPGCVVLKNDPNYIQGFPDLLILFNSKWAALEAKQGPTARKRPNQDYYIDMLDDMSFAAFINPENKKEVLSDIQSAFRTRRQTRVS